MTHAVSVDIVADFVCPWCWLGKRYWEQALDAQKGIKIDYELIDGASHFYEKEMEQVDEITAAYVDRRRADARGGIVAFRRL